MNTKHLLAAIAIFAIAFNVQAIELKSPASSAKKVSLQPPQRQQRTPEERAKRESDWMKTDLALTDKQIPQVDSINLKYAKKQSELIEKMRNEGGDFQSIRPKMQELQTKKNEELKGVLTEDQMKKYLELQPQRRGGRGGQGGMGGGMNQQ